MRRIKRILDLMLAGGAVLCAVAMLLVVCVQIVCRFALPQAPTWTEEASRYLFIYMVSFAAALGIEAKAYVGFDALLQRLAGRSRVILQVALHATVAVLMAVMLWYSFGFVRVGGMRTAATLGIKMSYVYASICILSGFSLLYALIAAGQKIVDYQKSRAAS